ncbi:ATP-binding protein [Halobacteriales archaeon Cl-PHB]
MEEATPATVRVLYVQRDPAVADQVAGDLSDENERLAVATAADAAEAHDHLATRAVDCVVSGYDLPETTGVAFLEAVRDAHPDLPFVLYTSQGSEAVASQAISAGVTDYLPRYPGGERLGQLASTVLQVATPGTGRERRSPLFENAPRPVLAGTINEETGENRITAANEAFEEVFGYDEADVRGREVTDVVVPAAERAAHVDFRERVLGGESISAQVERTTAEGSRSFTLDVIPDGADHGRTTAWYAWYVDTTERDEREARLREQTAKIQALHDVATDIEACKTADRVYEHIVEAAESILDYDICIADRAAEGYLVPVAVSTSLSSDEYFDETPIDAEDSLAAEAYRTGEPSLFDDLHELEARAADTEFRAVLTVPLGEFGMFQAVSKTPGAFDETDRELVELLASHGREQLARLDNERALRERTEELERQNERLDAFVGIVSHDLRNPLTVASGHLELVGDDCDSPHVETVATALDRMDRLIADLLTLAREGETVSDLTAVSLADLVADCWATVATDEATLAVETDRVVEADRTRLRQLLENLIANAVDHGGSDVAVTVGDHPGGFYIADNGPGVPEDGRLDLFEYGTSRSEDGTGIGLAIVAEIAEAHGWSVRVTDSAEGGARFELSGVEPAE